MPLCEYWLSGSFRGTGFFVPHPLVRPRGGTCGRLSAEPVRARAGWGRSVSLSVRAQVGCSYNLQACADMPGQGCPSGGAPGAGASSLPATDSISLFFSRHRRRKRGCVYPLLGLPVRGRSFQPPSRRVFRRPLRRGGRTLPGQAPGIWSRMTGASRAKSPEAGCLRDAQ